MLQKNLWKRIIILLLIGAALMLPMGMIVELIWVRKVSQNNVLQEIASSSTGAQSVNGPVLIVPYTRRVEVMRTSVDNHGKTIEKRDFDTFSDKLVFLPDSLDISGKLDTFIKKRGIYSARIYNAPLAFAGRFVLPKNFTAELGAGTIAVGKAQFIVSIADARGIKNTPQLTFGNTTTAFQSGSASLRTASSIVADLIVLPQATPQVFDFKFSLELQGTETLMFAPTGDTSVVNITSNWAHPKFHGRYLPELKNAAEPSGFPAKWRISGLSANKQKIFSDCLSSAEKCAALQQVEFGVSLIEPVDAYQQLERSAKYAVLFIGLTLITFFAFELFKRLQIHPIQYLLVGAALAMFYLLLTSLSEHLAFATAYAIAAGACCSLIGFYVSYVLGSLWRGAGFGTLLAALYGALYVLLRSEDHALLLGSILLFGVLAIMMVSTRRVNWYEIAQENIGDIAPTPVVRKS